VSHHSRRGEGGRRNVSPNVKRGRGGCLKSVTYYLNGPIVVSFFAPFTPFRNCITAQSCFCSIRADTSLNLKVITSKINSSLLHMFVEKGPVFQKISFKALKLNSHTWANDRPPLNNGHLSTTNDQRNPWLFDIDSNPKEPTSE
jgi:hypothetical protein